MINAIPVRLNKEKFKEIKETIQNKFAELDYREEDMDYVICVLQEITQELASKKYSVNEHDPENCEHCAGEGHTIDEMLEGLMSLIRGKR